MEAAHDSEAGVLPDARGKEAKTGGEEEERKEGANDQIAHGDGEKLESSSLASTAGSAPKKAPSSSNIGRSSLA